MSRKIIMAGNWKMNLNPEEGEQLITDLKDAAARFHVSSAHLKCSRSQSHGTWCVLAAGHGCVWPIKHHTLCENSSKGEPG